MKIGICSDHAGVDYKARLIAYLLGKGHEVVNFGTDSTESCDYPDYAHPLAAAVESGEVDAGIALCGTGNGMALTLNHHPGIRILVMPARFVSYRMAVMMVRAWLTTPFAGGRHQRRIDKILHP